MQKVRKIYGEEAYFRKHITLATKGGFQNGQTAKARQGHRVQSLLSEDVAASYLCLRKGYEMPVRGAIGKITYR